MEKKRQPIWSDHHGDQGFQKGVCEEMTPKQKAIDEELSRSNEVGKEVAKGGTGN